MRILILSCNTGGGHNAAGKAVLEELQRRGVDAEMKDAMLFAGRRISEIVSKAYIGSTRSPWIFHSMYAVGGAISSSTHKSPVYLANAAYARRLYRYLLDHKIDAVFGTHVFPMEALTYIKHSEGFEIPCFGVMTDYTCHPFWEETAVDMTFIGHKNLTDIFIERGIPRSKVMATGIPVSEKFVDKVSKADARRVLDLPQDEKSILIMTGSMGFGSAPDLVKAIMERSENASCIVLTGNNDRMRHALNERYGMGGRVRAIPFTDKVPLYMDACDVLLTKPGGLSSTEAIVKNVPLVHTSPIPGCETSNADFFSRLGMSLCANTNEIAADMALRLLDNLQLQQHMLAAQRENCNPHAASDICDYILAHTTER